MHRGALDLLILLAVIWLVAVTLRPLGLPTVMGELVEVAELRVHGASSQAGSTLAKSEVRSLTGASQSSSRPHHQ